MYQFGDELYRLTVKGSHIKKMIHHIFRPEVFGGVHTEFYQFSKGMQIIVSAKEKTVKSIKFNGKPIDDDAIFNFAINATKVSTNTTSASATKENPIYRDVS